MNKEKIEQIKKDLNAVVGEHNIGIMKREGEQDHVKHDMAVICDSLCYLLIQNIPAISDEEKRAEMADELEETYEKFNKFRDKLNY